MHTPQPHWTRRLLAASAIVASVFSVTTVVAPAAGASVFSSCTISRCADARTARSGWAQLGNPTQSGWYAWPAGKYNYTGGTFRNSERQLPLSHTYSEYDVYPRARGASRDAYRIVRDRTNGDVYFTPDHYSNFYKL